MHWIDPTFLPETVGRVELFLLNPRGESDGLVLHDGTEIHFPPHLARKIHRLIKVGDMVKVRGVRPRQAPTVAAVSLANAAGKTVLDDGPPATKTPPPHRERTSVLVTGKVRQALHGPKGELRGALLEDGQIVRLPPHHAETLRTLFKPGRAMCVRGAALTTRHGTVIEAAELGANLSGLKKLPKPKPPHKAAPAAAHPRSAHGHAP